MYIRIYTHIDVSSIFACIRVCIYTCIYVYLYMYIQRCEFHQRAMGVGHLDNSF